MLRIWPYRKYYFCEAEDLEREFAEHLQARICMAIQQQYQRGIQIFMKGLNGYFLPVHRYI